MIELTIASVPAGERTAPVPMPFAIMTTVTIPEAGFRKKDGNKTLYGAGN
jgi:hypothetical protein